MRFRFAVENHLMPSSEHPRSLGSRCWECTTACWRLFCCFPCRNGSDVLDDSSTGALLRYQVAPSMPTTATTASTERSTPGSPSTAAGGAATATEERRRLVPKGHVPSDSSAAEGPATPSAKGAVASSEGVDTALLSGFEAQRQRIQDKLGAGLSLEDIDEDVCPTCLDPYTEENPKIKTKCKHHFHLACIYEWLERSQTCPMCGKRMQFSELLE